MANPRRGFKRPIAIAHAEDSQPNETINKRNREAPPLVVPTPSHRGNFNGWRGRGMGRGAGRGWRGTGGTSSGTWNQHAFRGNKSWHVNSNSRGGHSVHPRGHPNFDSRNQPRFANGQASTSFPSHWHQPEASPSSLSFRPPPGPSYRTSPQVASSSRIPPPHSSIGLTSNPPLTTLPPKPKSHLHPIQSLPKLSFKPVAPRRIATLPLRDGTPEATPVTTPPPMPPPVKIKTEETSGTPSRMLTSTAKLPSSPKGKDAPIKHERPSPSPPPDLPQRRLVTSGISRYAPVPPECNKAKNPNFKDNRIRWFRKELDILRSFGLRRINHFFRDDGMVIEWASSVPVWSDTLLPEPSNLASIIERAHRDNYLIAEKYTTKQKKPFTAPTYVRSSASATPEEPMPPLSGVASSALTPPPPPTPKIAISDTIRDPGPFDDTVPINHIDDDVTIICDIDDYPSEFRHDSETPTLVESATILSEERMANELLAIEYLEHYIKQFDVDRSGLAGAYAQNAIFSCCVHDIPTLNAVSHAGDFAPNSATQNTSFPKSVTQGRPEVTKALLSLGPHKYCPSGATSFDYDLLYLGKDSGILLMCYGQAADPSSSPNHSLSVDQSFVLRKNEDAEDTGFVEQKWPLVAVLHQMTVRDLSHLRPSQDENQNSEVEN